MNPRRRLRMAQVSYFEDERAEGEVDVAEDVEREAVEGEDQAEDCTRTRAAKRWTPWPTRRASFVERTWSGVPLRGSGSFFGVSFGPVRGAAVAVAGAAGVGTSPVVSVASSRTRAAKRWTPWPTRRASFVERTWSGVPLRGRLRGMNPRRRLLPFEPTPEAVEVEHVSARELLRRVVRACPRRGSLSRGHGVASRCGGGCAE
jgi:hypothetical protein